MMLSLAAVELRLGLFGLLVIVLLVTVAVGAIGLFRLNTDPELPSYFKKGGEIRTAGARFEKRIVEPTGLQAILPKRGQAA